MTKGDVTTFEQEIKRFEKKHEKTIFQRMSEPTKVPLEVLPMGSLRVAAITNGGGLPVRSVTQLYGPESCGKTTLAVEIAAENSRFDRQVVYFGFEQKLLTDYFKMCAVNAGGNMDKIMFIKPDSGAIGLDMISALIGKVPLIIIDSISACSPTKTIDPDDGIEKVFMGAHARLIGDWINSARFKLGRSGVPGQSDVPIATAILALNQVRAEFSGFGDGMRFPGGWAWRHALALNIKIARGKKKGQDDKRTMGRTRALVVKNTIGAPAHEVTYPIIFNHGIDRADDTLRAGLDWGIIENRQARYFLDGVRLAHGENKILEYLRGMPQDAFYELRGRIHAAIVAGKKEEPENVETAE
jgi:recombination protein RecA